MHVFMKFLLNWTVIFLEINCYTCNISDDISFHPQFNYKDDQSSTRFFYNKTN